MQYLLDSPAPTTMQRHVDECCEFDEVISRMKLLCSEAEHQIGALVFDSTYEECSAGSVTTVSPCTDCIEAGLRLISHCPFRWV